MKYSKRDLRAFDMFALLMIGIGGLFLAVGAIRYFELPKIRVSADPKDGKLLLTKSSSADSVEVHNWSAIRIGMLGGVFVVLGSAMSIGIRRATRNPPEVKILSVTDDTLGRYQRTEC